MKLPSKPEYAAIVDQPNKGPKSDADSAAAIVRRLTPSELESMRRSFEASAAWMDEIIRSGKLDEL